jgi:beta-galactosidase
MLAGSDRVLFGAAYYHEYQPYDRLDVDLDLMQEAHFSVIRVGESVWSTWEPEDGQFNLDWLEQVLNGAARRGISVILGTPTYAVPPWLARLYPEIAGERSTGERIPWGARQEVDFTHPAFLFHADRVIRKILRRYAGHPAVIGFQVDNEPGLHLLHNRGVFQRFVDDLRHRYGDVDSLNREWGLVYWSHRLSTWDDLWAPDGNTQPQYDVAWRRFQAAQTTRFINWQADIVREYSSPGQFVTTCISYDRPAVDDDLVTDALDTTGGNLYYVMQDGLQLPDDGSGPHDQNWATTGTWALYFSADRMYSSRQEGFLVTETNAMHIGAPWDNRPAFDGQWRQVAWALVARGARMVEYWHWHTLHFGTETSWGGVLPHSGHPGRTFDELRQVGDEFRRAGRLVAGCRPDAEVAFLYSLPNRWLMQKYPPLAAAGGGPDARAYDGIFAPFYRGAFDAGLSARILHSRKATTTHPAEFAASHPLLVVPGHYMSPDHLLDWLADYAAAGGHLVIGPRTGYADHEARARTETVPGRLAQASGVHYDEFSNLKSMIPVLPADGATIKLDAATATRWCDGLLVDDAQVVATYEHPHFSQWPAITTRDHERGRITCVGTIPDSSFAKSLFQWLATDVVQPWCELPATMTSTGAAAVDGTRLRFLHNWSWDPASVSVPTEVQDILTGETFHTQDRVQLGPWDVRVLAVRQP